jgi:hypothetical protein
VSESVCLYMQPQGTKVLYKLGVCVSVCLCECVSEGVVEEHAWKGLFS